MDDSPWFWFGLAYWSMVWAALGVAAGKPKGRGFAGGLLGLLLGPLGAAVVLALDPVVVPPPGYDPNAPPTY